MTWGRRSQLRGRLRGSPPRPTLGPLTLPPGRSSGNAGLLPAPALLRAGPGKADALLSETRLLGPRAGTPRLTQNGARVLGPDHGQGPSRNQATPACSLHPQSSTGTARPLSGPPGLALCPSWVWLNPFVPSYTGTRPELFNSSRENITTNKKNT